MPHIKMYTGAFCPYCTMAKQLFRQVGVSEIEEIRVDKEPEQFAQMQQLTGERSVPQIFIGQPLVSQEILTNAGKIWNLVVVKCPSRSLKNGKTPYLMNLNLQMMN